MRINIEPTPEMHAQELSDGRTVPLRVWTGYTDSGIRVEAYVFAIVPADPDDVEALQAHLPPFMRPSREQYQLVVPGEESER